MDSENLSSLIRFSVSDGQKSRISYRNIIIVVNPLFYRLFLDHDIIF